GAPAARWADSRPTSLVAGWWAVSLRTLELGDGVELRPGILERPAQLCILLLRGLQLAGQRGGIGLAALPVAGLLALGQQALVLVGEPELHRDPLQLDLRQCPFHGRQQL